MSELVVNAKTKHLVGAAIDIGSLQFGAVVVR